jgi:hypothetical protein
MATAASDLITQLQECNADICGHLFNFTGALQRDALPLSIGDEPLESSSAASASAVTDAQIPELAAQVHAFPASVPPESHVVHGPARLAQQ